MIDVLREHTPAYLHRHPQQAPPHVQGTLAKLALCRTAALGDRTYHCPGCDHCCRVYNSCTDRHCPRCSGARRANWLDRTSQLLLPRIDYFQAVFTLPDTLSSLTLGNRRAVYNLLFRSAWRALQDLLQETQGIEPAALMVLHTWNQELDHHPHVHAVVPGGGPSLDGKRWIRSRHRLHRRRRKPYLVDNKELSRRFRKKFMAGLKRLHRRGELQFGPLSLVHDYKDFVRWLDTVAAGDWVVYIQPPPKNTTPQHVLKYLARYLTGGPISDGRLISNEEGEVTFWARSKNKATGNRRRPFPLPGCEFTRRWALHILPKGFTKSRRYGGFSPRHCQQYLQRCLGLLSGPPDAEEEPADQPAEEPIDEPELKCPHCREPMVCIRDTRRRSWRELFRNYSTCPWWYGVSLPRGRPFRPPPKD